VRYDDIDLEADKFGDEVGGALEMRLRPPILDHNIAAFRPTELVQPLHECGGPLTLDRGRIRAQESDGRQLYGLLRPYQRRPGTHYAAEQRYELAPLQLTELHSLFRPGGVRYSITDRRGSVRGLAAAQYFDPAYVTYGSKARITAPQHCCPLSPPTNRPLECAPGAGQVEVNDLTG
jgi:hypothetical protein